MTGQGREPSLRRPALLLTLAFAFHNLEEGLTYPGSRADIAARLHELGLVWWSPSPEAFDVSLATLTCVGAAAMGFASQGAPNGLKRGLVRGLAWILLLNVVLPHVPAAVATGGYAPGVLTAVAVNLPLSLWVLRATRRRGES